MYLSTFYIATCRYYDKSVEDAAEPGANRRLLEMAREHSKKAIILEPESGDAHKWFAIVTGALTEHMSTKEKIQAGHLFKREVELAIKLKPNDPTLYHLLGRWCVSVAGLSWIERSAASALYGDVPNASFEEARDYLVQCDAMHVPSGRWKANSVLVAKCHIMLGNREEAKAWLDRALAPPISNKEDERAHAMALEMIETL